MTRSTSAVSGARGLVKEEDLGVEGEGARDAHALLLAAGELAGHLVLAAGKPHLGNEFARLALGLRTIALLHAARGIGDVLQDRAVREEVVVLEHEAKAAARCLEGVAFGIYRAPRLVVRHREVAKGEAAAVEGLKQGGAAQKR